MKTGGTSLRRMLVDAVGAEQVYPNDDDLAARPHGWYPGPKEFVEQLRSGRTHGASIFIGHFPYVLRDEFDSEPLTVALLRNPVTRTLSMLKHRKLKSSQFADSTFEQVLDDKGFVDRQIRDYQTKIFAFDSILQCPDTVDIAFGVDDYGFGHALDRLAQVDLLGLTEDLDSFCMRFQTIAGIDMRPRRDNKSRFHDRPAEGEIKRIGPLTRYDKRLYETAAKLVQ